MARARVIRKQERCFIELPKEFASADEVELFTLRDGYYLLSLPLPEDKKLEAGHMTQNPQPETQDARPATQDSRPTEEEIIVLRKLQSVKFSDRTPENVMKLLSENEKTVLRSVEKKGFANVFKGNKYKDGVYNISDKVFPLLKEAQPETTGQNKKQEAVQKTDQQRPPAVCKDPLCSILMKQGFLVIRDTREARDLSEKLKTDMKSGLVVGIKGFDGVFYVVTKEYFAKASKSILDVLKENSDLETIARNTKLETDGVRAVIHHLAESGDVIEKKKGIYAAV